MPPLSQTYGGGTASWACGMEWQCWRITKGRVGRFNCTLMHPGPLAAAHGRIQNGCNYNCRGAGRLIYCPKGATTNSTGMHDMGSPVEGKQDCGVL